MACSEKDDSKLSSFEESIREVPSPSEASIDQDEVFSTKFACITFNERDKIRLIHFPRNTVKELQGVLKKSWPRGIQSARNYAGAREFKLNGNPWGTWHGGDSLDDSPRRLICKLLEALYNMGWVLQSAVDVRKEGSKDILVFRHQSPPPPECEWVCISFDHQDRLRFVEPPPEEIRNALLKAFGPVMNKHEVTEDHFEIKFDGYPWLPSGEDTVNTPLKLLQLLETMERFGFSLYSSMMAQENHQGTGADEIIMQRRVDWIPGMPVFHR